MNRVIIISILLFALSLAIGAESIHTSKHIEVINQIFIEALKNEDDFQKLIVNKENYLPKIIKKEQNGITEVLNQFGLGVEAINSVCEEIENDFNTSFSNLEGFKSFIDLNKISKLENIVKNPLVFNENEDEIHIIYPFIKWGEKNDYSSGKVITWKFTKNINEDPELIDIDYDYNFGRTSTNIDKNFGRVIFTLYPVRSLEYTEQHFQLTVTIESNEDYLDEGKRYFDNLINEIRFPENIEMFLPKYQDGKIPVSTGSQMGKNHYFIAYLDYFRNGSVIGAQILPDIKIDVLGDSLVLEKPMILCKPVDL